MSVTLQDVMNQLGREETDYVQAARIGADALPHLRLLVQSDNPGLAAKAAFLAGSINGDGSVQVLELAAAHGDPIVRVAAAASARHVTQITTSLARHFLNDTDPGVRRWALRSLELNRPPDLTPKLNELAQCDPEPSVRDQARKLLECST